MNLRLNMIVQNSVIRLYRVPKGSQLLKRLGGAWHIPDPNDLPLPAPIGNGVKTTLRELAARVPANGPRIKAFPETPPDAPRWNGRVDVIPNQKDWDYGVTTNALTAACCEDSLVTIFCNGICSNEGRNDGKQLGATSAVVYQQGRETQHKERVLGETVTDSDCHIRALHTGLDALTYFLDNLTMRRANFITISSPSKEAVNRALDMSPHQDQEESLLILRRLDTILNNYSDTNIVFLWLPRKAPFVGFRRARQLALEAIHTAIPANIIEPHTINTQKEKTKDDAIAAWAENWHQMPRSSNVYQTALTKPPDGKTHHTFHVPHPNNNGAIGHTNTVKFSCSTHSTLYRFITGHAFTREYTQRFFRQHTQEQIACQCGKPLQTIKHILLNCPQYTAACRRHLTVSGRPRSIPQLLENSERVQTLLQFLEETGACKRPWAEWEPG